MHVRPFAVLALTMLLAVTLEGCWQSNGSLYKGVASATPLHIGDVVTRNPGQPGPPGRAVLTRAGAGYRLINADKGSSDFGSAFVFTLFALRDLPPRIFAFEAVSDDQCKPSDTMCHPMTASSPRYYGLLRLTAQGAEVENPDCGKADAVAHLPGVTVDGNGICSFAGRGALETALRQLAAQPWKTSLAYTYR